jgi:hypothetical protein
MRILFQHSVALLILYRTPVLICHIGLKYLKSLTLLTNSANAISSSLLLTRDPKHKLRQVQMIMPLSREPASKISLYAEVIEVEG